MALTWFTGEKEYKIWSQIEKESDRSTAIVGGSVIDLFLSGYIYTKLKECEVRNKLFRSGGPLSPLSVKIDLCYLLGLIDDQDKEDLQIIRKIRNEYAHSISIDSFTDPRIQPLAMRLSGFERHVSSEDESLAYRRQENPRGYAKPWPIVNGKIDLTGQGDLLSTPRQRFVLALNVYTVIVLHPSKFPDFKIV